LDELFPTLGDNVSTGNPLAALLNSLGTGDDRGMQATSLFNPFNLSPPRLHEIHAMATANLISQTQEAIMQEYNFTELDFDRQETSEGHNGTEQPCLLTQQPVELSLSNVGKSDYDERQPSTVYVKDSKKVLKLVCDIPSVKECCNKVLDSTVTELKNAVDSIQTVCDVVERVSEIDSCVRHIPVCTENEEVNFKNVLPNHSTVEYLSIANKPILNTPSSLNVNKKNCAKQLDDYSYTKIGSTKPVCKAIVTETYSVTGKTRDLNGLNYSLCNGRKAPSSMNTNVEVKEVNNSHQYSDQNDLEISTTVSLDKMEETRVVFVCHICCKQFKSADNLDLHHQNHQKYVCPETNCVRTFVSRGHLQYHLQAHE